MLAESMVVFRAAISIRETLASSSIVIWSGMDYREEALFKSFAVSSKRQRYVTLLGTKRGRDKILFSLDHFSDLDHRFCKQVAPTEQSPAGVLKILEALGAPSTCYVMSSASKLDGCEMNLGEALTAIIGRGLGTFVSCVPGKLAYFEGEEPERRYICHRDPP